MVKSSHNTYCSIVRALMSEGEKLCLISTLTSIKAANLLSAEFFCDMHVDTTTRSTPGVNCPVKVLFMGWN